MILLFSMDINSVPFHLQTLLSNDCIHNTGMQNTILNMYVLFNVRNLKLQHRKNNTRGQQKRTTQALRFTTKVLPLHGISRILISSSQ
jgi:hypothetical protein